MLILCHPSHGQLRSSIQKSEQKGLSFCGRVLSITTSGDKMASVTVPQFRTYIVSRADSVTETVNMLSPVCQCLPSHEIYILTRRSLSLSEGSGNSFKRTYRIKSRWVQNCLLWPINSHNSSRIKHTVYRISRSNLLFICSEYCFQLSKGFGRQTSDSR